VVRIIVIYGSMLSLKGNANSNQNNPKFSEFNEFVVAIEPYNVMQIKTNDIFDNLHF